MQSRLRNSLFIAAMALLVIAVAGSMVIAVTFSRMAPPAGDNQGTAPATQSE